MFALLFLTNLGIALFLHGTDRHKATLLLRRYRAIPLRLELKALMAHPGFERRVNPNAVESYLDLGYLPSEQSIFGRTQKLNQTLSYL